MNYAFPIPPRQEFTKFDDVELVRKYITFLDRYYKNQNEIAKIINNYMSRFGIKSSKWDKNKISSVKRYTEGYTKNNENNFNNFVSIIWAIESIYRMIRDAEYAELEGSYVSVTPSFVDFRELCVGFVEIKNGNFSLLNRSKERGEEEILSGSIFVSDLFSKGIYAYFCSKTRDQIISFGREENSRRRAIALGQADSAGVPFGAPYVFFRISAERRPEMRREQIEKEQRHLIRKAKIICDIYSQEKFQELVRDPRISGIFPESWTYEHLVKGIYESLQPGFPGLKIR